MESDFCGVVATTGFWQKKRDSPSRNSGVKSQMINVPHLQGLWNSEFVPGVFGSILSNREANRLRSAAALLVVETVLQSYLQTATGNVAIGFHLSASND